MKKMLKKLFMMTADDVKEYVTEQLKTTHDEVISDDGYVYAQGTFPVLLVAHMDTVHAETPKDFLYEDCGDIVSSKQGIGGDDRCGIYMILRVIQQYNCSVLFCEDEEIGMVGAEKFTKSELAKSLTFNYIIEFDRKGYNDAVFYDCDNPEFEKFITHDFYKTAYGTFSDISTIAPYLGCAAVNLSCGYYNAHTNKEYVVLSEMEANIEAACGILDRTTDNDVYEYIEANYTSQYSKYFNDDKYASDYEDDIWGSYRQNKYYMIEYMKDEEKSDWYDTWATSEAEAIGKFCMDNPSYSYNDIIDMDVDAMSDAYPSEKVIAAWSI